MVFLILGKGDIVQQKVWLIDSNYQEELEGGKNHFWNIRIWNLYVCKELVYPSF